MFRKRHSKTKRKFLFYEFKIQSFKIYKEILARSFMYTNFELLRQASQNTLQQLPEVTRIWTMTDNFPSFILYTTGKVK